MTDTIKKEELEALLWAFITHPFMSGQDINGERYMGMLCIIDMLVNEFELSIDMGDFDKVMEVIKENEDSKPIIIDRDKGKK